MKAKLPMLNRNGWIENKEIVIDKLFEHFLASEYSQTNLLYGEVASLKFILASSANVDTIRHDIISALNTLFSKYFDTVSVYVNVVSDEKAGTNIFNISMEIKDDGETYTLYKAVETRLGKITKFNQEQEALYESY